MTFTNFVLTYNLYRYLLANTVRPYRLCTIFITSKVMRISKQYHQGGRPMNAPTDYAPSAKRVKKTPTLLGGHFICWHLPIFPGRHQPSIFGTTELNFCVRDGNRWTLSAINTNLLTFVSLLRTVLIILRAAPNVNTFFKKI